MDPVATETTETPIVADSKVTEKVVEEDTPVVASGEETETAAPVEEAKAPAPAAKEDEETPAVVESSGVAAEAVENGNGEAEVIEPVAEEPVKRKVEVEEAPEVPEKRAKTDDVEAVEPKDEEVVA